MPPGAVLAAAVTARAHVIVTSNVRHFPDESLSVWRIVAQTPDQFLCELFERDPARMVQIFHDQAASLRRPPLTIEEVIRNLARQAPSFVELVHAELTRRSSPH